jgi:hypothetical protein
MMEKRLAAVPPQLFTANGGSDGIIEVASTDYFVVKQKVYLSANTLPNLDNLEIKKILNETQLVVGPETGNIESIADVSLYTVTLSATIAANIQKRPSIPFEEFMRAIYQEEPTVAMRTFLVDKLGRHYTNENPFPINASVSIGDVNVQLTHQDNSPNPGDVHDSIRIGDGTNEAIVNADGSFDVNQLNSLMDGVRFDSIKVVSKTFDGPTLVEYYSGGLSGALQASISIVYDVDGDIVSVVRT